MNRLALAGVAAALTVVLAAPGGPAGAAGAETSSSVTKSKTVQRAHLVDGDERVVEKKTVTVKVSQTQDLRDRQEIKVSWSGAHPTGGILADPNSGDARQEEYPVVLLQCRGEDSAKVSASKRLTPSTCWTQTYAERFQDDYNTSLTPWRLDREASAAERAAVVGRPSKLPKGCVAGAASEYWLPFVSATGTSYPGGPNGCAGMAPEAANVGGSALPSNTTYGVTALNGTGSADFDVWTSQDNASLGCSEDVACALVAVPIMGISCSSAADLPLGAAEDVPTAEDLTRADAGCRATGHFDPGQLVSAANGAEDLAVSGALWWAASNWRNRITIPIGFAPSSSVCDVIGNGTPLDFYGSEILAQATEQWVPAFCTDPKRFRFKHVQTGEPEARNLLVSGGVDAAFVSQPSDTGYSRPVVHAPVAFSGFAVTYTVDGDDGKPYEKLRLTPRLIAKLLTQSYPAINAIKEEYAALAGNPLNISLDPEFIALNPGIQHGVPASESASTLLAISSDSDAIHALTAYIQADPEARAWLDGKPDPWGMVVNPNYKDIELPVESWPMLDTFMPPKLYASRTNDCLSNTPVPYLPLVAAPLEDFASVTQAMQFSLANSRTVCYQVAEGVAEGEKLVAVGRQTAGHRFMLGLTTLADANRYQLDTAELQTLVSDGRGSAFTSAAGRAFVPPDHDSLRATAALLEPDDETGTWPIPYAALRSKAGRDAYPGAMVVYAAVPTHGLSSKDAHRVAQLLRFAAGPGQRPGTGIGRLPEGYLPLTAANHLVALASYTDRAATDVASQSGVVTPISPPPTDDSGPASGASGGAPGSVPPASAGGDPGTQPTPTPSASAPTTVTVAAVGSTPGTDPGSAGLALPLLVLLAVGAATVATTTAVRAGR